MNNKIGEEGYTYVRQFWEKNDNIRIIYNLKADNNICMIYASSNGIWNPNNKQGFITKIEENDKYEWMRWGGINRFKKTIFIRDVFKEWYVNGVNGRINSIDALIKYLEKETKGYKLVTAGNSAGGYIATIIGVKLCASHIYNFSGQISIEDKACMKEEFPELSRWRNNVNRHKYYNISGIVSESDIPIFYFYAARCNEDIGQFSYISKYKSVRPFAFYTREHGQNMFPFCFASVLSLDKKEMVELWDRHRTKIIRPFRFMFDTADIVTILHYYIPYMIYRFKHKAQRRLKKIMKKK